jgi:hypothetical protein
MPHNSHSKGWRIPEELLRGHEPRIKSKSMIKNPLIGYPPMKPELGSAPIRVIRGQKDLSEIRGSGRVRLGPPDGYS